MKKRLTVFVAVGAVVAAFAAASASSAIKDPGSDGCKVFHGPGLSYYMSGCH